MKCSKPLGTGVQQRTFHESLTGTTLNVTGRFKNYYDTGTLHGSYELSGTLASAGPSTATGSVTVTGGTGAYRGAKGKAKITCMTSDAGKTLTCSVTGKMTL